MNPIEHIWDALGRRVAGRQPLPQTLQKLERALLEEWDRILQLVINSLIDSMPQRLPPRRRAHGLGGCSFPPRGKCTFYSFPSPTEDEVPHLHSGK
ncbi:transposable element Tcb2 transposase [Trichonephila clavipes]|uniref:Transposable element Tcb2 transposase n=1 Tax=Trichonephila clavipes TaxID=2585209 RepID=A0A8X6VQF2_TRICX|nr:transposable element Tcb2 transposase [Trichonephila clavipes]